MSSAASQLFTGPPQPQLEDIGMGPLPLADILTDSGKRNVGSGVGTAAGTCAWCACANEDADCCGGPGCGGPDGEGSDCGDACECVCPILCCICQ